MVGTQFTRANVLVVVVLITHLFLGRSQVAIGQPTFVLDASLWQLQVSNADPVYRYNVGVRPWFSPNAVVESLIGPDGSVLVPSIGRNRISIQENAVPFSTIQEVFSGTWKFIERRDAELLEYEFTLPEITPDFFPEAPTIVSPIQGDTVGTDFILDWQYESGANPLGSAGQIGLTRGLTLLRRESIDPTSERIFLGFDPGFSEGEVTMRKGSSETRPLIIIPASLGADATFQSRLLGIAALSVPVTVTARIPEPTTIMLLGTAVVLLSATRRNRIT